MFNSIRRFFFGESKEDVLKDVLAIALEADFGHEPRKGLSDIISYCTEHLAQEEIEDSICG